MTARLLKKSDIKIYNEDNFQGIYDYYLKNLILFIFQYIYNEIYIKGNLTFTNISLIEG